MSFNVHKWNKQRYLAEAGLQESISQKAAIAIDKILDKVDPPGITPEDLGKAIAIIVKNGYQTELQKRFIDVLHFELGMKPLNEAEISDMDDDSLLSTYENKLKTHDWYYYMSDDSRKYNSGELEAKTLNDIKTELGKRGLADKAKELFIKYEKTR